MVQIDQQRTWAKVEQRLATETDPVLRRNLELLLQHMKAEATLDMDPLMATVSEQARYTQFGRGHVIEGKAAVRQFYEDFAASGAHKLSLDIDRLVVDRDCILTEGLMRMAYPGATLRAMGIDVDEPDAYYLYETHMAIVWPIDEDGLFIGEDSYTGVDGFAGIAGRKLDGSEIVTYEPPQLAGQTS
ncbi:MAG: nuclear transport factor 2 family protein [Actinomycetota bacterium]|nr:nuclear transport factor 2 family protein [Actinomycetota bacterium]